MVIVLAILMILMPNALIALDNTSSGVQGWHWYEEGELESGEDWEVLYPSLEKAKSDLDMIKKELEDKKAMALMYPTENNIKSYIQVQNAANDRAETFSRVWQRVIIKNPELDTTIEHPTNQLAKRVYYEQKDARKKTNIESFTQKYGLFFFFKSSCGYCHKFAPIVRMLEAEYGITVIPVSLDAVGLPEYPNPRSNNGIAQKLNIDIVPAVIAVNPKTGQAIPVSYGLVAMDELSNRINLLAEDDRL